MISYKWIIISVQGYVKKKRKCKINKIIPKFNNPGM